MGQKGAFPGAAEPGNSKFMSLTCLYLLGASAGLQLLSKGCRVGRSCQWWDFLPQTAWRRWFPVSVKARPMLLLSTCPTNEI